MVSVFGKIMHAEFALCKNYDFASLKYDRIGTYSANFSSIRAGRRIQFEPKSRAEIRSAGRYRPAPPTVARTLLVGQWRCCFCSPEMQSVHLLSLH